MLSTLSSIQINTLIASIIGDGEITKLYPKSRRKNNSYREHYGVKQKEYRRWKESVMTGLFYITPRSNTLRSKSSQLFTDLFPFFYNDDGQKKIPEMLLSQCTLPHFLAVIYMDDGSLCITPRINHKKKIIYLTPHVYLYLQNYQLHDLLLLKKHISHYFNLDLKIGNRNDGYGHILRTTTVIDTLDFLDRINQVTKTCPSMLYKTNWTIRLQIETNKYKLKYPNYTILSGSSNRNKAYDKEEIALMIELKKQGVTDNEIAKEIERTYWSVVYKLSELRKQNRL